MVPALLSGFASSYLRLSRISSCRDPPPILILDYTIEPITNHNTFPIKPNRASSMT